VRRWRQGGRDLNEDNDLRMSPPHQAGKKQRSGRAALREAGKTMAASWTVGLLASMDGRREGRGVRTAAAVLAILRHGGVVKVAG
jgi:hypothetical protein